MKKTMMVLLVAYLFILPGCVDIGSLFLGECTFSGPPGARYVVTYPDTISRIGTVNSNGLFNVPKRGFNCGSLLVFVGSNFGFSLSASPSSVFLPSPPASGTITGQGFDATYGMPLVEYFESNGFLVGSVLATSVSSDGTSLQAYLPDLSNVYTGTYQVKVTNKRYDGHYLNVVGTATMTGWGRDRTDSDGDGWYDDEDCDPYDPYLNTNCGNICGGGMEPIYVCP